MKYFTERNLMFGFVLTILIFLIISCFLSYYSYWRDNIDAVTENPILVHTQGVDPQNLHIVGTKRNGKEVTEIAYYKKGAMVFYENSYCKLRRAKAKSEWWLIDNKTSRKFWFNEGEYKELPLGCTPPTQDKLAPSAIKIIPSDVSAGIYHFEAVVTRVLPDGRERKEDMKTEDFVVIE